MLTIDPLDVIPPSDEADEPPNRQRRRLTGVGPSSSSVLKPKPKITTKAKTKTTPIRHGSGMKRSVSASILGAYPPAALRLDPWGVPGGGANAGTSPLSLPIPLPSVTVTLPKSTARERTALLGGGAGARPSSSSASLSSSSSSSAPAEDESLWALRVVVYAANVLTNLMMGCLAPFFPRHAQVSRLPSFGDDGDSSCAWSEEVIS
jgi:hypothetical protein